MAEHDRESSEDRLRSDDRRLEPRPRMEHRPGADLAPRAFDRASVLALQRHAGNGATADLIEEEDAPESVQRSPVLDVVGHGGGAPLDPAVQREMGGALGADFSDVRVHTDGAARQSADAVGARAYTVGNEVVFNEGAFDPASDAGRRTLAHELTHVVQQRSGPVAGTPTGDGVAVSSPSDEFEQEAERVAEGASIDAHAEAITAGTTVQREEIAEDEDENPHP